LHVQLIRFYVVFAFKSDPAHGIKSLVFTMRLLVFYGSKSDTITGSNLDANQHAAHTAALLASDNSGESIHARLLKALDKVSNTLKSHERKFP